MATKGEEFWRAVGAIAAALAAVVGLLKACQPDATQQGKQVSTLPSDCASSDPPMYCHDLEQPK